jgi:hypothetical protein
MLNRRDSDAALVLPSVALINIARCQPARCPLTSFVEARCGMTCRANISRVLIDFRCSTGCHSAATRKSDLCTGAYTAPSLYSVR